MNLPATSPPEIPIWVNGFQRWISGIGRKTTCDDVIRLLLQAEGSHMLNDERHINHYAIVERWHKVERPLDGRSRILKVYSTWGDEQSSVKFTLKRVNPTTPRDIKTSKRKNHNNKKLLQTIHPKRLLQEEDYTKNNDFTNTMEKLMKLILAQGETIQTQLKRLNDRDEQIHRIEHKVHRKRVEKLGSNYLLETYLGSLDQGEKENDSGVAEGNNSNEIGTSPTEDIDRVRNIEADDENDDDHESSNNDDDIEQQNALIELRTCISLFERLIRVNKRLEKQEQYLVKLHFKLKKYSNDDKEDIVESNVTEDAKILLQEQLEEAITLSEIQERELESNNLKLCELGTELQDKNHVLDCLRDQLNEIEDEQQQLQSLIMLKSQNAQTVTKIQETITRCNGINAVSKLVDSDSNSDTGLSSLHSSGEEGGYVLDTLV